MNAKQAAAYKAIEAVENGMIVGLGTGTTAYFAIERLGERVRDGLKIKAVGSSVATEELARKAGIEIVPFSDITGVDVYIDGADEVDAYFNLIKGGGGALVREKIIASNSQTFIVIIDETKRVQRLGKAALPVEVVPFAVNFTLQQLEKLGGKAVLRQREGKTFLSDNGNFIVDLRFNVIENPANLNAIINIIPGAVESGLFPAAMVHRAIVGYANGHTEIIKP